MPPLLPRTALLLALGAALPGASGLAQVPGEAPPPPGRLAGIVFDSLLRNRVLPDAEVVVLGTDRLTVTDQLGRWRLDSIPAGRHRVSFFHPLLDSIGTSATTVSVEVRPGQETWVPLAMPSAGTVYRALCPMPRERETGLLAGYVRQAGTGAGTPGATVSADWTLTVVTDRGTTAEQLQRVTAVTDTSGGFRLCGVPHDIPVAVRARASGWEGGVVQVEMDGREFLPFSLAVGRAGDRTAAVTGVVVDTTDTPLADADLRLIGVAGRTRSTGDGRFLITGVVPGTHTLEVRRIGSSPARMRLDLVPGERTELVLRLTPEAVALPSLEVQGDATGLFARSGFEQRRARGGGYYLDRDDIIRKGRYSTAELMTGIPGVNVSPHGLGGQRIEFLRAGSVGAACGPDFYLDGVFMPGVGDNTQLLPTPDEIQGMEIYKTIATTPPQYVRPAASCGVVLIWTRRGEKNRD